MVIVAPSILAADFYKLGEEIEQVARNGADWIHIDVMDGRFVPNITMGALVVKAIRPHTSLPLDVHLMIVEPHRYIDSFIGAGADNLTIHLEADPHIHRTIHRIKEQGVKAGVAINPGTSIAQLDAIIEDVDMVLVMSVNPGFGGQSFIKATLNKIRALRSKLDECGQAHVPIQVDGGIDENSAPLVRQAGAEILVAGNAVFGSLDRAASIREIRG